VESLRRGIVQPLEAGEGASVFLLRGACPALDAQDLGVLGWAMRAGRTMTALSATNDNGEPLRRRMRFAPVSPHGPLPADAARQGHKLARKVRAELSLGGEPLGDMRAFLEEHLGIAVLVDSLVSYELRAASILDRNRAAAAVVLASSHQDLERNPALARVYLAHELGHILFDPGTPQTIRLALDNRSMLGEGSIDLLESRAKGFTAELLIPLQGLCALFGQPLYPVATFGEAREMVAKTRDHFGTPTEIAARHLGNLGFIRQELILDLLVRPPPPANQPVTTLPAPAAMPCLLEALLNTSSAAPLPSTDPSLTEVSATPSFADDARAAAARAMDDLSKRALQGALEDLAQGREIAAVDALVKHLDDLFLAGEFEAARRLLVQLDPQRLPPKVLSGVLMVSKEAKAALGDARVAFFQRARAALTETWGLRPEQVEAICRRHA
jgi:Zn-dependent peptidase ImmA (M78 family)